MVKSITRFEPSALYPVEECERHYIEVHTRFVRHLFRQLETALTYHTNRVLRQYDLCGRWYQRPMAWRFVVTRLQGDLLSRGAALPESVRALYGQDHTNFLRDLRSFPVEEDTLFDRIEGQTAFAKYLFEFDRPPERPSAEAYGHLRQFVETLFERAGEAFGLRRVVLNRVLKEAESAPIREPGQAFTPDRYLPDTTKLAFLEVYFDQEERGDEFFADNRPQVEALVRAPAFPLANLYHVEERCGVDKR